MLRFDIKDKRYFASDPETGAIFGLTYAPSQDELRGIYVAGGIEYSLALDIESGGQLPDGRAAPTKLRINCGGMYFGLSKLFSADVNQNSVLSFYIARSLAHIQKERPIVQGALLCSNFEEFRRALLARGKKPLFWMPTDEELAKASAPD